MLSYAHSIITIKFKYIHNALTMVGGSMPSLSRPRDLSELWIDIQLYPASRVHARSMISNRSAARQLLLSINDRINSTEGPYMAIV